MGRKRSGKRKQIHLCITILICLGTLACALETLAPRRIIDTKSEQTRGHIAEAKRLFAQGNYGSALAENEKALSLAGNNSLADEPLLMIGLIYAYPANPARDAGKSILALRRLVKDHPESPLVEEAKTMISLLQENDKLSRSVERLTMTVEKLTATVERLTVTIDELKAVDIEIDQKKREKGK